MDRIGDSLAIEVLARFGEVRLCVTGTSMLPSVWPGDVVTVRRCALREVVEGCIVLATRDGRVFVHRAVTCGPAHVVTQGDALSRPDPPADEHQLLGRIVSIDRQGRCLDPPPFRVTRRIIASVVRRATGASRLLLVGDRLHRRWVCA